MSGNRKGAWSLHVTRNWRLTFRVGGKTRATRMLNPPHPGAFLATEVIQPLELSVAAAAKVLGVSRPALSNLLNGHADLSGDMALRVEQAFGVKMDTLMRMQSSYDIARTRERQHTIRVRRYQASDARP